MFQDLKPYFNPVHLLESSEFARGALLAGLIGWLGFQLRSAPLQLWNLIRGRFVVSVEIRDPEVFKMLAHYLATLRYADERCRRLSAELDFGVHASDEKLPLRFSPARGRHIFYIGRWLFWLERQKEEMKTGEYSWQIEYFTLNTLGLNAGRARLVIEQARDAYLSHGKRVEVYVTSGWQWIRAREVPPRSLESVVLPESFKEDVVADLRRFQSQRDFYQRLGMPYRRGYAFEGPPGTGKTSLVRALASEFKLNLYQVNLRSQVLDDQELLLRLGEVPPGSVILFEDVDCLVAGREDKDVKGVTLSGLLNGLDGVASQEDVIYVFTTNFYDRLDPALVRPGRIDRRFHFDLAEPGQVMTLFRRFFPGCDPQAVALAYGDERKSMAWVQGVLQQHQDDLSGALSVLRNSNKEVRA